MYPFSWHILELLGKFEIQNYIKNKWWSCKKSLFLENNSFSRIYTLYLGNNFFFMPVRFIPVFFLKHFFVFVQDLTTKIIWRKPKYYTYEHLIKFFSESQKRNDMKRNDMKRNDMKRNEILYKWAFDTFVFIL